MDRTRFNQKLKSEDSQSVISYGTHVYFRQIAQAAAHASRGLEGVGIRGVIRQRRGVREGMEGGAIRPGQSCQQTNNTRLMNSDVRII